MHCVSWKSQFKVVLKPWGFLFRKNHRKLFRRKNQRGKGGKSQYSLT